MTKWLRQFFEDRGYTGTLVIDEVVGLFVLRKPPAH